MFPNSLYKISSILKKLFNARIFRFLVCGVISAAFNVLLLAIVIEFFHINQPVWRNLANFIAMEISVFFSFLLYRLWVWTSHSWKARKIFRREIPLYHLSCSASIATRGFIMFPILDWIGINYVINSLIGIAIGSAMNYVISDKWVFKVRN